MIKVLILTPYVPFPIDSGGKRVFFARVDQLRHQLDVSVVLPCGKHQSGNVAALQHLWGNVKFHVYSENSEGQSRYYRFLQAIKRSVTRKIARHKKPSADLVRQYSTLGNNKFYEPFSEPYIEFVNRLIAENKYDVVQVEFVELMGMVHALPADVKKVFVHHELSFVRQQQEYQLLANPKAIDRYAYAYSKNFEIQCLNAYDSVFTLTAEDRDKLKAVLRPQLAVEVLPVQFEVNAAVPLENFQFNNCLVFVGGSDHFPNVDAIDWFLNTSWENLLRQNPALELKIIGKWQGKHTARYESKFRQVKFIGFADELLPAVKNSILIVPIRIGSGIRIKILELIALGVPLVTTSIGCEGTGLEHEADCMIADDASSFTAATQLLARNNALCQRLRTNARLKIAAANRNPAAESTVKRYQQLLKNG